MSHPEISVVVCTYNRAAGLRDALDSLGRLATEGRFDYELVVIDNGSRDETPQVIADAGRSLAIPLRGIRETNQGIVPARNRGLAEAKGRWIAFFDDDQLADRRWLLELYRFATERNVRCVGGAVELKLPADCQHRPDVFCRMLLGESPRSSEPRRYRHDFTGGAGNLMLETGLLGELGGFREQPRGRGEDTDLFFRLLQVGIECWYVPAAVVKHVIPPTRLEEAFFLEHARRMGQDIAAADGARGWRAVVRRSLLWPLRAAAWHAPAWLLARAAGRREAAIGYRARLAMLRGYFERPTDRDSAAKIPPLGGWSPAAPASDVDVASRQMI